MSHKYNILVFIGAIMFFLITIIRSLKDGVAYSRVNINRSSNPIGYWFTVIFYFFMIVVLVLLIINCASH